MKPAITLFSAFVGFLFLEGFARVVITFYHRIEFNFFGISGLPDSSWVLVILISVLVSTWLLTMLILTIIDESILSYSLYFLCLLILWRSFEIYNSYQSEPVWYFIAVITLHSLGVFLAYKLYQHQNEIIQDS
jgi:hypothetical protein